VPCYAETAGSQDFVDTGRFDCVWTNPLCSEPPAGSQCSNVVVRSVAMNCRRPSSSTVERTSTCSKRRWPPRRWMIRSAPSWYRKRKPAGGDEDDRRPPRQDVARAQAPSSIAQTVIRCQDASPMSFRVGTRWRSGCGGGTTEWVKALGRADGWGASVAWRASKAWKLDAAKKQKALTE